MGGGGDGDGGIPNQGLAALFGPLRRVLPRQYFLAVGPGASCKVVGGRDRVVASRRTPPKRKAVFPLSAPSLLRHRARPRPSNPPRPSLLRRPFSPQGKMFASKLAGAAGAAGAALYLANKKTSGVQAANTTNFGLLSSTSSFGGVLAPSPAEARGVIYYVKAALAGGICCGITHGAMTPVDVVKTRIQLDPVTYNKGMVGGFRQVIAAEGTGALLTGLGATVGGYFVQGWFKFGGVEFFKILMAESMGEQAAWDNRMAIYLASAAGAEFIADLFLCPLEAVRIRSVSDTTFPQSLPAGFSRILKTEGVLGFYAGLGPILFKQVPYTMAKFAVQGLAAEAMYKSMGSSPDKQSTGVNTSISLASGVIAGVASAIISHPADTLLSKINKKGAGGTGSTASRLMNIAKETGFVKLATTGLGARCVMIGTLTAGQFGIFDIVMGAVGAKKFHFHPPGEKH